MYAGPRRLHAGRVLGAIRVPFAWRHAATDLHSGGAAADQIDMSKPRTGTMTDRGDGRWRLQVAGEPDPLTGKRRRLSRTVSGTKAEAREALQRLVVETGAGLQGGATSTVASLLAEFMTTATLAPTTRQDWQSVITHHLMPALGELPLWKLTARHCDQFYAAMAAAGSGPSRVRCAHVVLHRAVAQAVRWEWLARNPVSAATRPPVPRTTITPPDAQEVRAVMVAAERQDPVLACWLQVAVATGARRGEVCALRWSDIDFTTATVRIERSVSATKSAGVAIRPTKTGRVRLVSLTGGAVDALVRQRARAERTAADAGRTVDADDQIFTSDPDARRPWRPELVTRRW